MSAQRERIGATDSGVRVGEPETKTMVAPSPYSAFR
jgi:hypothetical protein